MVNGRGLHFSAFHYTCTFNRGDMAAAQKGQMSVSVWMDRKAVTVMSSSTQPGEVGEVQRRQKDYPARRSGRSSETTERRLKDLCPLSSSYCHLQQVHGWCGPWRPAPWLLQLPYQVTKVLPVHLPLSV